MIIRFRGKPYFGHVRVRVFVGKGENYTLAKAGELMVDPEQWKAMQAGLQGSGDCQVQCIEEEEYNLEYGA